MLLLISRISLTLLFVIGCSSCDTGFPIRNIRDVFVEKNFIWTDSANQSFDRHAESFFYHYENDSVYVINRWLGEGQLGGSATFTILCCSKTNKGEYKLDNGAVLHYMRPSFVGNESSIRNFGILKPNNFKAFTPPNGKNDISLIYDGDLDFHVNVDYFPLNYNWLRFNVRSSENPEQVLNSIKLLLPFLHPEQELGDLVNNIKPLMSNSKSFFTVKSDIISKLEQISRGNTYSHVISVLGPPSYEQESLRTKRNVYVGKSLYYILEQKDHSIFNAKEDRYITIYINANGNVMGILKKNLEKIKENRDHGKGTE